MLALDTYMSELAARYTGGAKLPDLVLYLASQGIKVDKSTLSRKLRAAGFKGPVGRPRMQVDTSPRKGPEDQDDMATLALPAPVRGAVSTPICLLGEDDLNQERDFRRLLATMIAEACEHPERAATYMPTIKNLELMLRPYQDARRRDLERAAMTSAFGELTEVIRELRRSAAAPALLGDARARLDAAIANDTAKREAELASESKKVLQ